MGQQPKMVMPQQQPPMMMGFGQPAMQVQANQPFGGVSVGMQGPNVQMNTGNHGVGLNVNLGGTGPMVNTNIGMPGINMQVGGTGTHVHGGASNVNMSVGAPGVNMQVGTNVNAHVGGAGINVGGPGVSMNVGIPNVQANINGASVQTNANFGGPNVNMNVGAGMNTGAQVNIGVPNVHVQGANINAPGVQMNLGGVGANVNVGGVGVNMNVGGMFGGNVQVSGTGTYQQTSTSSVTVNGVSKTQISGSHKIVPLDLFSNDPSYVMNATGWTFAVDEIQRQFHGKQESYHIVTISDQMAMQTPNTFKVSPTDLEPNKGDYTKDIEQSSFTCHNFRTTHHPSAKVIIIQSDNSTSKFSFYQKIKPSDFVWRNGSDEYAVKDKQFYWRFMDLDGGRYKVLTLE